MITTEQEQIETIVESVESAVGAVADAIKDTTLNLRDLDNSKYFRLLATSLAVIAANMQVRNTYDIEGELEADLTPYVNDVLRDIYNSSEL